MATQDEVKVYTPEVIADQPFPISGEGALMESNSSSTQSSKGVYGAKETPEKQFPQKMVAKELFSTAINTISKKILKVFEFAKSGAIQIGEYIHGLSGEIKISPDGIVAKNKDGNTTFALDGTTGDAIFSGDVRAGTFTTDYFNVDESGNVEAQSIKISSASSQDSGLVSSFDISTTSRVDVTGASITTTFAHPTIVLLTFYMNGWFTPSGASNTWANLDVAIQDGDTIVCQNAMECYYYVVSGVSRGAIDRAIPFAMTEIIYCDAGSHTFKITAVMSVYSGTSVFHLRNGKISYVTLGNW